MKNTAKVIMEHIPLLPSDFTVGPEPGRNEGHGLKELISDETFCDWIPKK